MSSFNFIEASLNTLKLKCQSLPAYAGASSKAEFEDFMDYVNGNPNFGFCKPEDFSTCYYKKSRAIKVEEDILIGGGTSCNDQ